MEYDVKQIDELLTDLGLSKSAAVTYRALLELESVSIRKLAEHTGINRGTTYDALKSLVTAGLVSVRRVGQREHYAAESPEKLNDIIRDKRKALIETAESAKLMIPHLLAHHVRPEGKPLVRYYEDDEGVVTILKDILQTCSTLPKPEYYCYSSKHVRKYLYRKFPGFTDRRTREGIAVKVIAVGEGGDPAPVSERKWLAATDDDISSYTLIYGDKVALISISSDYTPYGVVIEDKGVATMQRLLFEQLWGKLD